MSMRGHGARQANITERRQRLPASACRWLIVMSSMLACRASFPAEPPHGGPFDGDGPLLSVQLLDGVRLPMGASTGCTGARCAVSITVFSPADSNRTYSSPRDFRASHARPVVVVSPGFLIGCERYATYGKRLASWGFMALLWQPEGETLLHTNSHWSLAHFVEEILGWVYEQNATAGSVLFERVDLTAGAMLLGHSRGAKANSLLAAACAGSTHQGRSRNVPSSLGISNNGGFSQFQPVGMTEGNLKCTTGILAVVNLDPVDGSTFDSDPSVLPLLSRAKATFLHIGSEFGNRTIGPVSCAPSGRNFEAFFAASPSPTWLLELLQVRLHSVYHG